MAVIQDEQGNNKPIVTDTSHVFDVNGNPLHGELFIGETIASDDVEEIDGYAHESEIATINSNLTVLNGMGYKLKKGESITLSAQSIAVGNGAGNKAESILTNVELADDVTSVSGVFTASNLYNYAGTAVTVTSSTALKYGKNVAISQTANIGSHVMGAASFAVTLTAS